MVRKSLFHDNKAENLNEAKLLDRMGSRAPVEGLTLNRSVDKESLIIGKKAKFNIAEAVS